MTAIGNGLFKLGSQGYLELGDVSLILASNNKRAIKNFQRNMSNKVFVGFKLLLAK